MVEEAQKFKEDYRTFARAIDTTRHELPVKNCYIEGEGRVFLGELLRQLAGLHAATPLPWDVLTSRLDECVAPATGLI